MKTKRARGRSAPAGQVRMLINLGRDLHATAKVMAAARGQTLTQFVIAALRRKGVK